MTTNPFYPHYKPGDKLQYLYLPSPRPRYAGGSRAARRHLIGLDILHAVWVGLEDVKGMDKPRRRLATLITRARRAMGDYSQLGGWSFARRKDFLAYQRSLNGLMAAILRMPEITDGLCWLIVGAGWAVDLHGRGQGVWPYRSGAGVAANRQPDGRVIQAVRRRRLVRGQLGAG